MFDFLKAGREFNKVAKAMNGMNVMIQELIPRIERSYDKSEFKEDILVLAFISKRGVLDRLEKYNWTMDAKIIVPTIDRGRITLTYALMQTVGKVSMIAAELEMSEVVQEVMEGGNAYRELEKHLPLQIIDNI
jgi:hypothetical protein